MKKPSRFPRLNAQTESLLGKRNLKTRKRMRRALQRLEAVEKAGMDFYDGAKFME
jgi:hypothetical protein